MASLEVLKEKLEKREIVFGSTFNAINSPKLPAIFKKAGADFMLWDCEHGIFSPEIAHDMLMAARACDLPSICRVQDCQYYFMSKCFDMGADAILVPRTETFEQVERAIDSIRIPPVGHKGSGGAGLTRPGEKYDDFNKNRLMFLQMESPLGIQNLPEMLTRYGDQVAGVIVGPRDMSAFSANHWNTKSEVTNTNIHKVIEICQKFEKSVGMFVFPATIEYWVGEGMNILWCAGDTFFMEQGFKSTLGVVNGLRVSKGELEPEAK